jgi:hypothetical protein
MNPRTLPNGSITEAVMNSDPALADLVVGSGPHGQDLDIVKPVAR